MTKRIPFLLVVALAVIVAACGGSAGTPAGDGTIAGGTGDGRPVTSGEVVDEVLVTGAIAKLATLPAFSYETKIGSDARGTPYLKTITGVERPLEASRSYYASANDGVTWASVTVNGAYFTDIGRGLEPFDPPRDDATAAGDPDWIANLLNQYEHLFDEFELVGDETIDGRGVKHLALGERDLERMLQLVDDPGLESFSFELWIDAADGYLVRAHYGRQPFGASGFTSLVEFAFELSDVGCDCPITAPAIAATPIPATPEPVATPVVAPAALSCSDLVGADIDWAPGASAGEPVDIVKSWTGVLPTDVMALDGMRIVLIRADAAVAEWTFDMFGRPYQMSACQDAGIATMPPEG